MIQNKDGILWSDKHCFNYADMAECLRREINRDVAIIPNQSHVQGAVKVVFEEKRIIPDQLLVFTTKGEPASIALFVLGGVDAAGDLFLSYRDIESVEAWFSLQRSSSPSVLPEGVWYLFPPAIGVGYGRILTHSLVFKEYVDTKALLGYTDRGEYLKIPAELAMDIEHIPGVNMEASGWVNHSFIEPEQQDVSQYANITIGELSCVFTRAVSYLKF